jgi:hypothetical protein
MSDTVRENNASVEAKEDTVVSRRRMLGLMGLTAAVAYAAPTLLTVKEARASGGSGGGSGGWFGRRLRWRFGWWFQRFGRTRLRWSRIGWTRWSRRPFGPQCVAPPRLRPVWPLDDARVARSAA